MDNKLANDLIMEIGSTIVTSEEYAQDEWVGISVVGNFYQNEQSQNGFVYLSNGEFEARAPGFPTLDKLIALRDVMNEEKGEAWHQCLVHVTRPDFKINIQFEYEDPRRWKPKKVSMDMSEYAESIKPPSLAAQV